MIDKYELECLEDEYKTLAIAELTDDVDCSLSTIEYRESRLAEIEDQVGEELCHEWFNKAEEIAEKSGYASGKEYIA